MTVPEEVLLAESAPPLGRSPRQLALRRLLRDRVALLAALLLLAIFAAALLAPWIAPADADAQGADLWSLLLHGGRSSLLLGVLPVVAACIIGTATGLLAGCCTGFCGGLLRGLVLRTTDVFCAFPPMLLAVVVVGVLGGGALQGLMALTLVFTPQVVREAERLTTQVQQLDYVAAARLSGDSSWGIVRHHVLGSVLGAMLPHAASLLGTSLILSCGLSFLGLGAQPPEADWGLLLQTPRTGLAGQPLLAALPALMIAITALAFHVLALGLRAALHPQR